MEMFDVHCPSPKLEVMMYKYSFPYLWSISHRRWNKLQHMLDGNIDREEVKTLCDELNFNDIKVLVTQLKKTFSKTNTVVKKGREFQNQRMVEDVQ